MLPSLTLENFTVSRSGLPLFKPVSVTLRPGEACEVLGPNGIGKTSLLESLAGFSRDTMGRCSLPSSVSYLSMKLPFDAEESVALNLLFWKKFWHCSQRDFEQALNTWHLRPLMNLPYAHLSQGQKQRVNLARLVLQNKTLWLLDEPTATLDQEGCKVFQDVLKEHLKKDGMALSATHCALGATQQIILCPPSDMKEKELL